MAGGTASVEAVGAEDGGTTPRRPQGGIRSCERPQPHRARRGERGYRQAPLFRLDDWVAVPSAEPLPGHPPAGRGGDVSPGGGVPADPSACLSW